MTTVRFQMETLSCASCIKKIETTLSRQNGVKEAKVMFHSSRVKVDFDEATVTIDQLEETVTKLGYPVLSRKVS